MGISKMLKALIVLAIILLLLAGILIGKRVYDYMNKPIELELIEIARLNTEKELSGTWWAMLSDDKHPYIKEYALKLPDVDFSTNNLIISAGREIKQMTYTIASKNKTPYKDPYIGIAIYKRQLHPHTMFVYKIDKVKLIDEEGAGLKPELRIED